MSKWAAACPRCMAFTSEHSKLCASCEPEPPALHGAVIHYSFRIVEYPDLYMWLMEDPLCPIVSLIA